MTFQVYHNEYYNVFLFSLYTIWDKSNLTPCIMDTSYNDDMVKAIFIADKLTNCQNQRSNSQYHPPHIRLLLPHLRHHLSLW